MYYCRIGQVSHGEGQSRTAGEIGQEKRARTRAQLIAAASALFSKRSWASVTIDASFARWESRKDVLCAFR